MRIEDYGLIGDLQTAALVGRNGSIDWLCFPRFDSDACFASLLGTEQDGRWLLAPDCPVELVERRYRDRSLVHELDFHTAEGVVRVTDFMPPRGTDPDVVRIVEALERKRADADGARDSVRLRLDRPLGAAARRRQPGRDRRPGCAEPADSGGGARREPDDGRRVHGRRPASGIRSC